MFLGYNSLGLHFQDSGVVLNDSAVKNGWGIVFTNIFRHKQGSNEQKAKIIQRELSKLWTNYLTPFINC